MNKFLVLVSFLLVTSQILSQTRIDLTADTSLVAVFNENEIKGLASMVQYVDDMVLNREKEPDSADLQSVPATGKYQNKFKTNTSNSFSKPE